MRANSPAPELNEALGELGRHTRERPSLAAPLAMLRDLLPALYAEPVTEQPPPLTRDSAVAKLADGVPLLRGEPFAVDARAFGRRWLAVCEAVQRHQAPEPGRALADALRNGRLDPAAMVAEVLAGQPAAVHARAEALGLDAGLTASVLALTLFPVLSAAADALAPLRQGIS